MTFKSEKEVASATLNLLVIEGTCSKDQETWHGEEPEHGQPMSLSAAKSPLPCMTEKLILGADELLNCELSVPLQEYEAVDE